ncbi:MAG: 50S ribosomal protein L13, partial [Myxococcales bacterium]
MKTRMVSKQTAQRNWVVMDVKDKVLGRAATQIASMLRGKHKPTFTPHADTGDFVVVVNAEKVRLTGNKWRDKPYIHHTL